MIPIVRPVLISEVNELSRIAAKTFFETYVALNPENRDLLKAYTEEFLNPIVLQGSMKEEGTKYFFLEVQNQVAGYLKIVGRKHGTPLELEKLYLIEGFSGQGLGQKLLDFVKELATSTGARSIQLSVYEQNISAIHFYKKNGFKQIGTTQFSYSWKGIDYQDVNWLMKLVLTT